MSKASLTYQCSRPFLHLAQARSAPDGLASDATGTGGWPRPRCRRLRSRVTAVDVLPDGRAPMEG